MLHMIQTFSGLIPDILVDGSMAGGVKNLQTTTDRKHRLTGSQNLPHKPDLK